MASKKNLWSSIQLNAAIQRVKTKELSLRQAALLYGVPKSMLSDHVAGKSTTQYGGIPKALSAAEEAEIVVLAEVRFPKNQGYVNAAVCSYFAQEEKHNPFGKSSVLG